ncbi:MAG: FAD/NAD(P)-binding oxidoreductase [Acetobacteraceae bacterium]|nr:FAD/NAD(P)-binding oxidoreductase [Acetobacteraceae bacterium]
MTRPATRPSCLPRLSRRAVLASALATPLLRPARAQGRVRVAVVGGGWGGLSAARHVRKAIDGAEVTLIEPNRAFFSCPLSIFYLVGERRAESLTFPFDGLIREGVRHVAERAQAIDRTARVVVTETQRIPYDFLVLSPGIEYMEEAIPGFAEAKGAIPVGFRAFEQEAVRRALEAHPGGDIVLSVPPVPYRCPIAPYERAALFAQWMDRRGLPGKVILLDLNPAIPIGGPTIQAAFRELYPTRLEHHQGVKITRVDAAAKRIETDRGVLAYGTASLIPPMRAASIVRQAGLGERWAIGDLPELRLGGGRSRLRHRRRGGIDPAEERAPRLRDGGARGRPHRRPRRRPHRAGRRRFAVRHLLRLLLLRRGDGGEDRVAVERTHARDRASG